MPNMGSEAEQQEEWAIGELEKARDASVKRAAANQKLLTFMEANPLFREFYKIMKAVDKHY